MAYLRNFLRVAIIGTVYNKDAFSFGMTLIGTEAGIEVPPTVVPPALITALNTYWGASGLVSTEARLTTVKVNLIGTDGRYVNDNTVQYDYPTPLQGTTTQYYPAQISYAVGLRTASQRGRAHAGRFYLPLPGLALGVGGVLTAANVNTIKTPTDIFLKAVNTSLTPWRLGVVSNLGSGAEKVITHARYGQVLDTMRSRRNKLVENYADGIPL